jgi:hypothetical protein
LPTEQLRSCAHGIRRVVNIVELVRGAALRSCHLFSGASMDPGSHAETRAARVPQRGGLSLSGGSLTGYRRAVRETPSRGDHDAGEQRTVATTVTVRGYHLLMKDNLLLRA